MVYAGVVLSVVSCRRGRECGSGVYVVVWSGVGIRMLVKCGSVVLGVVLLGERLYVSVGVG